MALLVAAVLSIYKPWGMTAYGRRQQQVPDVARGSVASARRWEWVLLIGGILPVILFLVLHVAGAGH